MKIISGAAPAAVVCALAVTACGPVDTGVRIEQVPASDGAPLPSTPSPGEGTRGGEAVSVDPVQVLRDDPGVDQGVKDVLAWPCEGEGDEAWSRGWYPVYTEYLRIPDTDVWAVIVNVQDCSAPPACNPYIASYVYRLWTDRSERVFSSESAGSRVDVDGDAGLFVDRGLWGADDSACPQGTERTMLEWAGERLVEAGE
ncbi:hypothetical protein [Nocardiopsis lucentensis]|uniref:hypothetical protein n=1 Tax=Nocardiopsis lucentensis TaxID=53441 RepID=UPI00034A9EAB|nr:hypothetical protein [Nocardiopsis lucentensis]